MTAVDKLLAIARAEVGYLEKASPDQLDDKTANAGSRNYTKYARDLDALGVYNGRKQGYAWCDVFADWCFIQAFGLNTGLALMYQPMGGCGAGVKYSAGYYRAKGQFVHDPQPGDQIFFYAADGKSWAHTGIVARVFGGKVYTIEGNTAGSRGVVSNGGGVWEKSYALTYSRIAGYGRPDWDIVQEEDEEMTKEQFAELWLEMRKDLQDNDAADWSDEARAWCVANGIVKGGSDDSFNGMWEDVLSREQMAVMIYRFAKLIGVA